MIAYTSPNSAPGLLTPLTNYADHTRNEKCSAAEGFVVCVFVLSMVSETNFLGSCEEKSSLGAQCRKFVVQWAMFNPVFSLNGLEWIL